jgi:hypothetical protein
MWTKEGTADLGKIFPGGGQAMGPSPQVISKGSYHRRGPRAFLT